MWLTGVYYLFTTLSPSLCPLTLYPPTVCAVSSERCAEPWTQPFISTVSPLWPRLCVLAKGEERMFKKKTTFGYSVTFETFTGHCLVVLSSSGHFHWSLSWHIFCVCVCMNDWVMEQRSLIDVEWIPVCRQVRFHSSRLSNDWHCCHLILVKNSPDIRAGRSPKQTRTSCRLKCEQR